MAKPKRSTRGVRKRRAGEIGLTQEKTKRLQFRHTQARKSLNLKMKEAEMKELEKRYSHMQQALLLSEARYRAIVEDQTELICKFLPDGTLTFVNEAYCRYFGLSREELLGKSFMPLIPEEDQQVVKEKFSSLRPQNPVVTYMHRVIMPDGSLRWQEWTDRAIFDKEGKLVEYQSVGRDVTERIEAAEALRKSKEELEQRVAERTQELRDSEERYRLLVENMAEGMLVAQEGRIKFLNPRAKEILGYAEEEIYNRPFSDFIYPDDRNMVVERHYRRILGEDPECAYSFRIVGPSGEVKWIELNAVRIEWLGKPAVLNLINDITERKRTETALRESEERYRTLFETTGTATVLIEKDTIVSLVNSEVERLFGYSRDQIRGRSFLEVIFPEDREKAKNYHMLRRTKPEAAPSAYELRAFDRWGRVRNIFVTVSLIPGTSQSIASLLDITDRKKLEENLEWEVKVNNALADLARSILGLTSAEHAASLALECACNLTGSRKGFLVCQNDISEQGLYITFPGNADVEALKKITKQVLDTRLPLLGNSNQDADLAADNGGIIKNFISVPLIIDDNLAGQIVLANTETGYNEQDLRFLERVADLYAIAFMHYQLEESQRKSEDRYRYLFETSKDAIYILSLDGNFIDFNDSMLEIFGYSREELFKLNAQDLYEVPGDRDLFIRDIEQKGFVKDYPVNVRRKDGGIRNVLITAVIRRDESGRVVDYYGIIRDITPQKQAERALQESYTKLQKTMEDIINAMSRIVEVRDPYTAGHQQRVMKLAVSIGKEMGLPEEQIESLRIAALLHDIGKIFVPAEILSKPGRINEIEFSLIKTHPGVSYEILKDIGFFYPIAQIVLQHHERCNGSGYPAGLKGEGILLEARILAVADVVEAMSSYRPYRPALGIEKAQEEIVKSRGVLYDPAVVDACLEVFKKGFQF